MTQLARFANQMLALTIVLISTGEAANARPYQGSLATRFVRKDNNSIQHFTIYDSEVQQIKASNNWTTGGPLFYAFNRPISGLVPLYRLQKGGDHFFTTDPQERLNAINTYGYSDEQICCYISAGPIPGTVPLLRYLANGRYHIYVPLLAGTTSPGGLLFEGTAGYVWPIQHSLGGPTLPPPVLEVP